jgi:D-amino-acid dehydrogenase
VLLRAVAQVCRALSSDSQYYQFNSFLRPYLFGKTAKAFIKYMKTAVIGAGIIGITTAYELAVDGHEVTVFEQRGAAAEGASFANAGVVAPGYVTPWAAPGMPFKMFKQMWSRHAAVRIGWPLSGADLAWMWQFWRACTPQVYAQHRAALQRLAFYSRARLHAITDKLQLQYDRADGYMVLLRHEKDAALVQPSLQVLRDAGVAFSTLHEDEVRKIEPALNPDTHFFGAVHLPQDEVGNCRQFAHLLKDEARTLGVNFEFNSRLFHINRAQAATVLIASGNSGTAPVERAFDAVVLCAGTHSAPLLRSAGVRVPLVPIHGYSVSAQVREPLNAPRSALMDEHYKVAISRLGNRVRVAGSAEIGGRADVKTPAAMRTLYKVLHDWFPGAGLMSHGVQEWKGARPMLPSGPPLIGASGIPGLWLNTGHGSSGWALSCGSARALADMVAGRAPEVPVAQVVL